MMVMIAVQEPIALTQVLDLFYLFLARKVLELDLILLPLDSLEQLMPRVRFGNLLYLNSSYLLTSCERLKSLSKQSNYIVLSLPP